jgi:epoxyqueuosine reductase
LEGVKSFIAVLMNYFPPEIIPEDENFIISKYAYGQDYHQIVRNRLNNLISFIGTSRENLHAKAFVDSGPVLEKTWAQRCGVGWQGKNTLIINKSSGSFFFIGIILADLELEPDPPETDHCGNCDKCVRSCPTNALDIPYQLSISRCISYMTIEQSGEITPQMKNKLNDRIYGCDKCQDVCPFNQYARPHQTPEFLPSEQLMSLRKKDWIALTEADFIRIFVNSPIRRVGIQKLTRNMP